MHLLSDDFTMARGPRLLPLGIILLCMLSLLWYKKSDNALSYFKGHGHNENVNPAVGFKSPKDSVKDVHNSTLGFQKVFVLNLAERPDKLDAFALASTLTGFTAEIIRGVRGEEVVNKALPSLEGLPEEEEPKNNVVGCWRAHLNFAQTVVMEGLTSAIILEDDADWDTKLKDQLALFAQGSQFVTAISPDHKPHSPYGDDWDLLWLGHCSSQIKPDDERRFVIENDDTVPITKHRVNFAAVPDMVAEGYDNNTRIVYEASDGVCLYGYALSFRGARKLLRGQAQRNTFVPIDIGIGDMCRDDPNFKCVGVFPQLIDSHKGAGRLSRDSDIGSFSPQSVRQKGYTFNIVHSTRLNIDHLLAGETDMIERQWPSDPEVEGPLRARPVGRVFD